MTGPFQLFVVVFSTLCYVVMYLLNSKRLAGDTALERCCCTQPMLASTMLATARYDPGVRESAPLPLGVSVVGADRMRLDETCTLFSRRIKLSCSII